jgi:hypothetical protein
LWWSRKRERGRGTQADTCRGGAVQLSTVCCACSSSCVCVVGATSVAAQPSCRHPHRRTNRRRKGLAFPGRGRVPRRGPRSRDCRPRANAPALDNGRRDAPHHGVPCGRRRGGVRRRRRRQRRYQPARGAAAGALRRGGCLRGAVVRRRQHWQGALPPHTGLRCPSFAGWRLPTRELGHGLALATFWPGPWAWWWWWWWRRRRRRRRRWW